RTPNAVYAHGFLTINGEKMSKSRGVFITAHDYLASFSGDYLRYYFATKLSATVDDIDLNLQDFVQKVNSDLVGKVVNLASRSIKFIHKLNDGKTSSTLPDQALWKNAQAAATDISELYEQREYSKAMRMIMALADDANAFFDAQEPWKLAKDDSTHDQVVAVCSQSINQFALIMAYLKPVLPETCVAAEAFLNTELSFSQEALLDHPLEKFKPLMARLDTDEASSLLK
ncbi:MAG: class I tRNA ligase family protein, partial [Pseudomonadota bacterium]